MYLLSLENFSVGKSTLPRAWWPLYDMILNGPHHVKMCTIWSGPLLSQSPQTESLDTIIFHWRANAHMKLYACPVWIWIYAFCACSKTSFFLMWPTINQNAAAIKLLIHSRIQMSKLSAFTPLICDELCSINTWMFTDHYLTQRILIYQCKTESPILCHSQ